MTEIIDLTNTSDEEEAMIKPSKAKKVKLDNAETMQDELDLQAALRASLLPSNPSTSLNSTPQNAIAGSSTGTSRLELEEARLERQRERERNGTIIKSNLKPYSAPNATTMGDIGSTVNTSTTSNLTGTQSQASSSNSTSNRYFQGAVRNVYNQWDPSNKAAMTFRDTSGPQNLMTRAFVSGYSFDDEWVSDQFSDDIELYMCRPPRAGETPGSWVVPGTKRFGIFPILKSKGIMHVKLNVFVYPTFMRIVICSANPVDVDWKILENTVYIHDFPLLSNPSKTENRTHNGYSQPIADVMKRLGTPPSFMKFFLQFDFSSAANSVKTVVSVQGTFDGWSDIEKGGGIASLANAVTDLGLGGRRYSIIEAAGSSLGNLTSLWLAQFQAACSGIHPEQYFRLAKVVSEGLTPTDARGTKLATIGSKFKIVFPTLAEVVDSFGGKPGGGTIFCIFENWQKNYSGQKAISAEIRSRFFKNQNQRNRILSHAKSLLAIDETGKEGWIYVGSHNFTAAAWGRMSVKDQEFRSTNNNYELGVVFPIKASSKSEFDSIAATYVSYKRPLMQYDSTDEPWCQEKASNK